MSISSDYVIQSVATLTTNPIMYLVIAYLIGTSFCPGKRICKSGEQHPVGGGVHPDVLRHGQVLLR